LRIVFEFSGKRYKETVDLPPSETGKQQAALMRRKILDEINLGCDQNGAPYFSLAKWFPKYATPDAPTGEPPFKEYAERFMVDDPSRAKSTLITYRSSLNHVWYPKLSERPMDRITYNDLVSILNEHPEWSPKTRNNNIIPVQGAFKLWVRDKLQHGKQVFDPAAALQYSALDDPEPDPLTLEEVNTLLGWMATHESPQVWNYFETMIFTGLRVSEGIALPWPNIDWNGRGRVRGYARVNQAFVRGELKGTKTKVVRDVELLSRAYKALQRQKEFTFLANGFVFHDPATSSPYSSDYKPRVYWDRGLRACGIRARDAKQTRHTFATINLMAGANPAYIARMMGHKNSMMVHRVYSKWIDRADNGRELEKVERALDEAGAPSVPQVGLTLVKERA
jgi:integrase